MARAKDYRYKITEADEKLPKKGLLKVEDGVAVYDRLLKTREISKYKLIDLNTQVKKITKHRVSAGMKQETLAELTGISIKTIQGWEFRGMNSANLVNCVKVADALGVKDLRDLMEDEEGGKQ